MLPDDPADLAAASVLLMSDLTMLVCTGGRERTEADFDTLLTASGWRLVEVVPTEPNGYAVLRADPV